KQLNEELEYKVILHKESSELYGRLEMLTNENHRLSAQLTIENRPHSQPQLHDIFGYSGSDADADVSACTNGSGNGDGIAQSCPCVDCSGYSDAEASAFSYRSGSGYSDAESNTSANGSAVSYGYSDAEVSGNTDGSNNVSAQASSSSSASDNIFRRGAEKDIPRARPYRIVYVCSNESIQNSGDFIPDDAIPVLQRRN
ncbi:hypothetical protein H4R20_005651, partial [Coemansia guatemalensis]